MQRVFYAVFAISAIKTGHTVSIKDLLIAPLLAGMDGAAVRAKGTPSLSTSDSTYKHAIGAVYNWIPPPRRAKPAAGEGWGGGGRYCLRDKISIFHGWCPKKYAASNKSVVDIEKSDGKCLNVIEHLLGKTAGFTHRTAYPLAQTAVISLNADGISLPHLMLIILKGLKKRHPVVRSNSVISNAQCFQSLF